MRRDPPVFINDFIDSLLFNTSTFVSSLYTFSLDLLIQRMSNINDLSFKNYGTWSENSSSINSGSAFGSKRRKKCTLRVGNLVQNKQTNKQTKVWTNILKLTINIRKII